MTLTLRGSSIPIPPRCLRPGHPVPPARGDWDWRNHAPGHLLDPWCRHCLPTGPSELLHPHGLRPRPWLTEHLELVA